MKWQHLQGKKVYIDTNPFIYFVEGSSEFAEVVKPLFDLIDQAVFTACTSHFTLTELFIKPHRNNLVELIEDYYGLLLESEKITLFSLHQDTFLNAAKIGGETMMRTPDSIHVACAVENHCDYFITNDKRIRDYKGVKVVQISDLLPS